MSDGVTRSVISAVPALELGHYLAAIREEAGLKQAELAGRVPWSQAVLSRIEGGERPVAPDELKQLLDAIGTPAAHSLQQKIRRQWRVLPRPPLDHPDQDALWAAEEVAQRLEDLRSQPDVKLAFERRLTAYVDDLKKTTDLILRKEHQVAFIGRIGVGKSTAICRLTKLEITNKATSRLDPVLETGGGRTTVCEVHLRTGTRHGIRIDPCSTEEIQKTVMEFAGFVRGDFDKGGEDAKGIPQEIERAVRNLSKLNTRQEKGAKGKFIRKDLARELAKEYPSARELGVEILTRMELHRRDQRDIWYDVTAGKPPLEWLMETFRDINNGRLEGFTLPKRIDVFVPERLLDTPWTTVELIDTKGIDGTTARADLESFLDDPHTLAIVCSEFVSAPEMAALSVLERAKSAGVRAITDRVALLILPHPGQATEVKDEETRIPVETVEEGYAIKEQHIQNALNPSGLSDLPITFFNSRDENPSFLREFLAGRIQHVRDRHVADLTRISQDADAVINNHEKAQMQAVLEHAASFMRTGIVRISKPDLQGVHLHDELIDQIRGAHHSTIRATVNRAGEWYNLNYPHILGHGARLMAASSLLPLVQNFDALCATMLDDPGYSEARELITQANGMLQSSSDELLRKLQLLGQAMFRDEMSGDSQFWANLQSLWGQGGGYRAEVVLLNSHWFENEGRSELEKELRRIIEGEWAAVLKKVSALLEVAPGV